MARPEEIDSDLTLEIDGQFVTPGKFLRGVRAFFGLLDEVTQAVSGTARQPDWAVQVKAGSNLIGVRPMTSNVDPGLIANILNEMRRGIGALEGNIDELQDFPIRAVRYVKDLGKIAGTDEHDDTTVRVWIRRDPVTVTHKSVATAAELLREAYEDHGSVEGRLQVASERGSLHVMIYEPLWDKPIRCYVKEEMLAQCLNLFGKRVEVFGLIKYRPDGHPISIEAEEIVPFPQVDQLPSPDDVRGILRNYA